MWASIFGRSRCWLVDVPGAKEGEPSLDPRKLTRRFSRLRRIVFRTFDFRAHDYEFREHMKFELL